MLEVVDENDRPVPPGVVGYTTLVTTLYNRALPLIRYEYSDLLTVAQGSCRADALPCASSRSRDGAKTFSAAARAGGHINVHAIHLHALLVRIPAIRQFEVTPQDESLLVRVATRVTGSADDVLMRAGSTIELSSSVGCRRTSHHAAGARDRAQRHRCETEVGPAPGGRQRSMICEKTRGEEPVSRASVRQRALKLSVTFDRLCVQFTEISVARLSRCTATEPELRDVRR